MPNSNDDVKQMRTWIIMILVALVSGGGGSYFHDRVFQSHEVNYTHSEADKLERRLDRRLGNIEIQHQAMMEQTISIITEDAKMHTKIEALEERCSKVEKKVDQVWTWTEPLYKRSE